jgi:hypothetical protein
MGIAEDDLLRAHQESKLTRGYIAHMNYDRTG